MYKKFYKCPDCGSEHIGMDDECDPVRYWCVICGLQCDELNNLFEINKKN